MFKSFVISLVFFLILFSCKEKKEERLNVSVYELSNGHRIVRNSYLLIKQTKKIGPNSFEIYKDFIKDSSFVYALYFINPKALVLLGDTFHKINDKKYFINNKQFIISEFYKKRDYGYPDNKISYVYYNNKTGLTACFYNFIYRLDYIEYESTKKLKNVFLKDISVKLTKNTN